MLQVQFRRKHERKIKVMSLFVNSLNFVDPVYEVF